LHPECSRGSEAADLSLTPRFSEVAGDGGASLNRFNGFFLFMSKVLNEAQSTAQRKTPENTGLSRDFHAEFFTSNIKKKE